MMMAMECDTFSSFLFEMIRRDQLASRRDYLLTINLHVTLSFSLYEASLALSIRQRPHAEESIGAARDDDV